MDTVAGIYVCDEVLLLIFTNLDLESVPNVALACKRWAGLMRDGELMFNMALRYLSHRDTWPGGRALLLRAVELKNANAINHLGTMYQRGKRGFPTDAKKAKKLYVEAAEAGCVKAWNNVGWCYEKGVGVAADGDLAFKYYKTSADAGEAQGMNNLGWCYQKAIGVEESMADAYYWYKEAATLGLGSGHNNLGWCLWKGLGVEEDYEQAQHHFETAARLGNDCALRSLRSAFKHSPYLKELRKKNLQRKAIEEQKELMTRRREESCSGAGTRTGRERQAITTAE